MAVSVSISMGVGRITHQREIVSDLRTCLAILGEDGQCQAAGNECKQGLSGVEESLALLNVCLLNPHLVEGWKIRRGSRRQQPCCRLSR